MFPATAPNDEFTLKWLSVAVWAPDSPMGAEKPAVLYRMQFNE